jgi:hypothetical protein
MSKKQINHMKWRKLMKDMKTIKLKTI